MLTDIPSSPTTERLEKIHAADLGGLWIEYVRDTETGCVGLAIVPTVKEEERISHRPDLRGAPEIDVHPRADQFPFPWMPEPLVQLKWLEDAYPGAFSNGHTLRNSESVAQLRFFDQRITDTAEGVEIVTFLESPGHGQVEHHLRWRNRSPFLELWSVIENTSQVPQTLQMISSFTLGHLTPFDAADASGRLIVHRYRSQWSAEGRVESLPAEALGLERSWAGYGTAVERFGQIGSMPVRRFFPFVAVEDKTAKVVWAATLAWGGSWQMELSRTDDSLCFSGGLADADFGQWTKILYPGESFATPHAYLTTVAGDLTDASQALVAAQEEDLDHLPSSEQEGGIVFNEWCETWGEPSLAKIQNSLSRLRGTPARYFVIDAGWYCEERALGGTHGDWIVNEKNFPSGLCGAAEAIREAGFLPGLWFEMETCGAQSAAFHRADLLLHRDGIPLTVAGRRFLDLTKPAALGYLRERVLKTLSDNHFSYLKVDYNDTLGVGGDGSESLGETLRQHIEGVYGFFDELRDHGLIVECCSSGGHRIEGGFVSRTHQFSFSDAHECRDIPIIAAAVQQLAPAAKSQIWAVLHAEENLRRTAYSLAATFLGRMCLSGKLGALSPETWHLVREAMDFYQICWPVIRHGRTRIYGPSQKAWRHPQGWQAVVRTGTRENSCIVVVHTFSQAPIKAISVPLPPGDWRLAGSFPQTSNEAEVKRGNLEVVPLGNDAGAVFLLAGKTS